MIKVIISILITLFQFNCAEPVVQVEPVTQEALKEPATVHPMVAKIKGILQEGWDVAQSENKISITRQNPVTFYNPISLPSGDLGKKMIEEGKWEDEYKITLELGELISDEKYREFEILNGETELEIRILEAPMKNFRSKGDYDPKTPKDKFLYEFPETGLSWT